VQGPTGLGDDDDGHNNNNNNNGLFPFAARILDCGCASFIQPLLRLIVCDITILSTELSSPRSFSSSRSSYGLPSPFSGMVYPTVGMKPVTTISNGDDLSPSAAAATCMANQPQLSPMLNSAAKDEPGTFPTKQPTMPGER